jgi:hypothetical protein
VTTMESIVLVLCGAVLGALIRYYVPQWLDHLRERRRIRRAEKRRNLLENPKPISAWLLEYYRRKKREADLFQCKIGDFEIPIPFLTKADWQRPLRLEPTRDGVVSYAETTTVPFFRDMRLIEERMALGQTLFNEPACFLDRIECQPSGLVLHLKPCEYFDCVTSLIRMEEETFAAVKKNRFDCVPLRDSYLSGLDDCAAVRWRSGSVGCAVVLAVRSGKNYEVLVHKRSHLTVTFGGLLAVTPNFGLAPIPKNPLRSANPGRQYDIIFYNLIKEYLEEICGYEELIRLGANGRLDPLWFMEVEEAKRLRGLIRAGLLSIEFLGFGFDALNGCAIMALLARIDKAEFGKQLRRRITLNWEVFRNSGGTVEAQLVPIGANDLASWLREERYHTGAAFALSLAARRLMAQGNDP